MVAKYRRFYHETHESLMRTPLRAFFAYCSMMGPVEAEEALLALRVAVEPWRDPKRGDDGWVRRLQALAQAGQPEPSARPLTPEEAPSWGIKVIKAPKADASSQPQSTEKGG